MTEQIIDVADLDCIFLTYDEPKKDKDDQQQLMG